LIAVDTTILIFASKMQADDEDFQDGRSLGQVTVLDPFNPANATRLGLTTP
jgi:hypothetical protein